MDETALSNIVAGLVQKNGDNTWNNGNGIWILLLFFLFFGNGGWGNNRQSATQQDVNNAFDFNQLDNGIRSIGNGIASLGYDNLSQINNTNMLMTGGFNNVVQALAQNGFGTQQGFCDTNRNIDAVRYENAQNTTAITMNDANNTQKILDKLCQMEGAAKDNTIAQLRSDLQAAQLTLSNAAQTSNIISAVRPTPIPAYITASPYAGYGTSFGG